MEKKAVVYVVGAGPGDPELITLKGRRLLGEADLVVYAGSLVNPQVLELTPPSCRLVDSHGMRLADIVELMAEFATSGRRVVRLASGDPSLYGSLQEMKEELEDRGVSVKVVPGVSSLAAAAASLAIEYTQPLDVQSLVVTRLPGRTPVRPQESLEHFAATGASIALFLSVDKAREISRRCVKGGMHPKTPVAVVHKASWPEERVWWTTLERLPGLVEREDLKGSSLVLVLPHHNKVGARSFLYGGDSQLPGRTRQTPFILLPVSTKSSQGVVDALSTAFPKARVVAEGRLSHRVARAWGEGIPLVLVGPVGVAVRVIAPLLRSKTKDPSVVVVDIAGSFSVALTGGHHGANALAKEIAQVLGAVPVITTGTQVLGVISLEELAEERGLLIHPETDALLFNKAMLEGEELYSVGMGWRKGTTREEIEEAYRRFSKEHLKGKPAVMATGEAKSKEAEKVLLPLAKELGAAMVVVPNDTLNRFPGPSESRASDKLGVVGVAEPAALAVLPQGEVVVPKVAVGNVTFALAYMSESRVFPFEE